LSLGQIWIAGVDTAVDSCGCVAKKWVWISQRGEVGSAVPGHAQLARIAHVRGTVEIVGFRGIATEPGRRHTTARGCYGKELRDRIGGEPGAVVGVCECGVGQRAWQGDDAIEKAGIDLSLLAFLGRYAGDAAKHAFVGGLDVLKFKGSFSVAGANGNPRRNEGEDR
jgi:hypothetical protein